MVDTPRVAVVGVAVSQAVGVGRRTSLRSIVAKMEES